MIDKLKYPVSFIFVGFLIFAFYEYKSVNEVYFLDSFLIDNYMLVFIILSILTTSFFHYCAPEFRSIFNGEETHWLSRLKLAVRILITFPGLILCYHLFTKSSLSFINRKIGPQKEITIRGKIVNKYESSSKTGNRYYLEVKNDQLPKILSVKVDPDYYEISQPGELYEASVKIGYLGYMYK